MMKSLKSKQDSTGTFRDYIRPVAISSGIGIAVSCVLLILFAMLLSFKDMPHIIIDPLAVFAIVVGTFVAGFVCSKICREKGLVLGALCGIITFLVLVLGSMMITDDGFGIPAILRAILLLLSGSVGGVIGVNTRGIRK